MEGLGNSLAERETALSSLLSLSAFFDPCLSSSWSMKLPRRKCYQAYVKVVRSHSSCHGRRPKSLGRCGCGGDLPAAPSPQPHILTGRE